MKALVYYGNKDVRLETDWPEPSVGPGRVKLRILGSSICATDIEEWQHGPLWVAHETPNPISGRQVPLILGHEAAGEVIEIGDGVTGVEIGQRVAIENVETCGVCFWCKRGESAVCPSMSVFGLSDDGGLAEFASWRGDQLIPLPDSISDSEAPLAEPTTVAIHAVRRSGIKPGDTAALIGCGTVGLLTLQVAKAAGAKVIAIDQRASSLDLAKKLGADYVLNSATDDVPAALADFTDDIGPDFTFETAGAERTPVDAINWTRRGGTVVLVGIYSATPKVNFNEIVGNERTVIGSVAASPGDYRMAVDMIGRGLIDVSFLVSDVISLDDVIERGFERMIQPNKDVFRIVVQPG
ncbi:MAG: zinc-binding dehydrogenase [Chloroflexi bacterium]|nr:zinc-binding dehydrogenase [Chloroflexota bacterium]